MRSSSNSRASRSSGLNFVDSGRHKGPCHSSSNSLSQSDDIASQARRIRSQGGGIFVYTGLEESWRQLEGREGQNT